MKTTIDLPEALLYQAKVTAAQRRTTLKNLVMEGLERVISTAQDPLSPSAPLLSDAELFETDSYGVPVLKQRGVIVTDAMIEQWREAEGI